MKEMILLLLYIYLNSFFQFIFKIRMLSKSGLLYIIVFSPFKSFLKNRVSKTSKKRHLFSKIQSPLNQRFILNDKIVLIFIYCKFIILVAFIYKVQFLLRIFHLNNYNTMLLTCYLISVCWCKKIWKLW